MQLLDAMEQVRAVIGDERSSGFTDSEVKRVVWDAYFDVSKSISVLLGELLDSIRPKYVNLLACRGTRTPGCSQRTQR